MTEREDNLWARRPHGRHAELFDAEYAKQLERIARIRMEVSASLPLAPPRPAPPPVPAPAPFREVPRREPPPAHWDAAPVELAIVPLAHPVLLDAGEPWRDDAPDDLAARRDAGASRPYATPDADLARLLQWRNRLLVAVAGLASLVAIAVVVFAERTAEAPAATVFHVPGQPTGLVASGGRVWVAGPMAGAVWILDGATGRPAAPALRTGGTPARVVLDARYAWIADTGRGLVVRAPRTGAGARRLVRAGPDVADIAIAAGAVWTASSADGTVRVLDARGRRQILQVGARPIALAADASRVVAVDASGTLIRLDARTRRASGPPITLGGAPVDVALAGTRAWIADANAGTVRPVELGSGVVGPAVRVGRSPVAIAADAAGIYVLCRGDRTLVRLDSAGSVRSRVHLAHAPTALALDSRHIWIAAGTNEVIRVDR